MLTRLSPKMQRTVKIFACLVLVNLFLFMLFSPTPEAEVVSTMPEDHVEFFVKGELKTSFAENKKLMLISPNFHHVLGPVYLKSHEVKETGEHYILHIPEKWLKQHLQLLTQTSWQMVPYTDGLKSKQIVRGESYEIHY